MFEENTDVAAEREVAGDERVEGSSPAGRDRRGRGPITGEPDIGAFVGIGVDVDPAVVDHEAPAGPVDDPLLDRQPDSGERVVVDRCPCPRRLVERGQPLLGQELHVGHRATVVTVVSSADERRHRPGPELRWAESWTFDFWSADGLLGGWVRVTLLPNLGRAWYHAFLAGPDRQLVAVVDPAVPIPDAGLEFRTTGLWATHICETPHDHWTVGLEAFGLGVDDPMELYGRQFGDQVPLGFDLEWEAACSVESTDIPSPGYRQACDVSGEILVGGSEIDFEGVGWRDHRWGPWPGWDQRWLDVRGRLDQGSWFAATIVGGDVIGAQASLDGTSAHLDDAGQRMAGPGMPAAAELGLDGRRIGCDPVAVTPLELVDPEGRVTRAPRALCRCSTAEGRSSYAWVEWNEPRL